MTRDERVRLVAQMAATMCADSYSLISVGRALDLLAEVERRIPESDVQSDGKPAFIAATLALPQRPEGVMAGPYKVVEGYLVCGDGKMAMSNVVCATNDPGSKMYNNRHYDTAVYLAALLNAANGYTEGSAEK